MRKTIMLMASLSLTLMATGAATASAKAKTSNVTTTQSSSKKSSTKDQKKQPVVEPAELVKTSEVDQELPYHLKSGYIYTSSTLQKQLGNVKTLGKTTWYVTKKGVIDRSAQGSGNSVFYQVKSGNGKQTGWVWHGNLQSISEGTFDIGMKNSDYFNKQNIITLGDSITHGYDGYETLEGMGYPNWLARYLDTNVTNVGYNGAYLCPTESASTDGDLTTVVNANNFKNYGVATIAYGTNDYGHTDSNLDALKDTLAQNIRKMRSQNKKLIIYGILPLTRYDYKENSDETIGKGGYTMNELRDAEAEVYKQFDIPYLDWRDVAPGLITDSNYKNRLWDERLHPSAKTYQMMGRDIAKFMIDNYPKDRIPKSKQTKKTTTKKTTTKKTVASKTTKHVVKTTKK
ncbi:SGNH/GDSL hydrolase family protein [Lentilactobacillus curieae]|nr:SGNH/GDSL hydrolase family protein [Lentilactobacillus curieae]